MQRIRLLIPLVALAATIALGLSWTTGMAQEGGTPECNCIDGHTKLDGVYGWDPQQQRFKCVPTSCYVITE